jgi:predicted enzyme related to lactoylglutathione lyase
MSERDEFPAGVPCWVDTMGPDPERLADFYGAVFGWEFSEPGPMPGDPPGRYYVARLRGRDVAGVASLPAGSPPQRPGWNTYVRVDDADAAAAAVRAAGGTLAVEPFDAAPAGSAAVALDPEGASFCLWEPGSRQGAQLVNEPGAWSMSFLNTADPDRAGAFYGEVFGWTAEEFEFGDLRPVMFRLPGFVGGLPEQPVPRDLVAVAMPGDVAEQGGPSWGVDFWVADTEAATAAATENGGTAIEPPHDRPGFRSAVLADPNGAAFGVSQLVL